MVFFCKVEDLNIEYAELLSVMYEIHLRIKVILEIFMPVVMIRLDIDKYRVIGGEGLVGGDTGKSRCRDAGRFFSILVYWFVGHRGIMVYFFLGMYTYAITHKTRNFDDDNPSFFSFFENLEYRLRKWNVKIA